MPELLLNDELRRRLKQPLGQLIRGTPSECILALRKLVESEKPPSLILVGDAVSRNAASAGITPTVMVIDKREMRQTTTEFVHNVARIFRVKNSPGTIHLDAWRKLEEAASTGRSVVYVDGEEDLLTLVAILVAPERSFVVYGQPQEGIVVVRVLPEKKNEIRKMVESMERRE